MERCLAAADLVICRAGASTLSELQAVGRASILIPSPNVAENHQYHNAMALVRKDAAVIVEEKDLTGDRLIRETEILLADEQRRHTLGENAKKMAYTDAAQRIMEAIASLV
ncbi:UDP-N-acetylglucosamine--N-acetylmuramyl-(pentapeptide) pyrophosphoryl-undecaprenol N-acetylglucosamine transferase [bioreactor metagenome]|uniref:UDP-N-acetylglucosamine--N-acetylmuramyl-(Pentapeptide) pyrophosphoryl-undecaprenol N-acetylglucosamine transferase n=1 Tax=bioreactor metagenome TaxID=1076179 RepID=A0A645HMK7_9ZZZZ